MSYWVENEGIGSPETGRYCDLNGFEEQQDPGPGTDLRKHQWRREIFLRFYEFHLRYRSHPGAVYYLLPKLSERFGLDPDMKMWLAYLNGNTQNPLMSYVIWLHYPDPRSFLSTGVEWFNDNWERFQWDTDRRYQKRDFPANVKWYFNATKDGQDAFFRALVADGFQESWKRLRKFPTFGRLSAFSYGEYLRIQGIDIECDDLFLEDLTGSMSHRNGLAKVLGRDDLDFKDKDPKYAPGQIDWLKEEAFLLLAEAQKRFRERDFYQDVGYFTLESTLCTYKSWHREGRRYANVYNDMLHDRIRWAEGKWPEVDFSVFWDIRREVLPEPLRLEDNQLDVGVKPLKQNHYRETGRTPMLGYVWKELWSDYDSMVQQMDAEAWYSSDGAKAFHPSVREVDQTRNQAHS